MQSLVVIKKYFRKLTKTNSVFFGPEFLNPWLTSDQKQRREYSALAPEGRSLKIWETINTFSRPTPLKTVSTPPPANKGQRLVSNCCVPPEGPECDAQDESEQTVALLSVCLTLLFFLTHKSVTHTRTPPSLSPSLHVCQRVFKQCPPLLE